MLKLQKTLVGALLSIAILMVAVSAKAQQMRPDDWMGRGMHMGGMGPGMMMHGPTIEGRLAYLKAELGITETQTPAWTGYATAVKARMSVMQGTH